MSIKAVFHRETDGRTDGNTVRRTDGKTVKRKDRKTDGWTDGLPYTDSQSGLKRREREKEFPLKFKEVVWISKASSRPKAPCVEFLQRDTTFTPTQCAAFVNMFR